ncbi:nucleoside-diphosphate sugar epimerase [Candidatus Marinamargulisbacteria bacterium SCGC AAA071-K20]|nr:nucleoside-diphosphate sugar epimerase [Candidatus Marinamargulisbacteria bacterium SCGC AAA071-K20]
MHFLDKITPKQRRIILFIYDICAAFATISVSFSFFYPIATIPLIIKATWWVFALNVVIRLTSNYIFHLYDFLWRYASTKEFVNIVKSVSLSTLIIVCILFMTKGFPYQKRILLIDWAFNILCIGSLRAGLKIYRDYIVSKSKAKEKKKKRVIIIGAGDGAVMIARELVMSSKLNYKLVGFVDDKPNKVGQIIYQAPVLGLTSELPRLVEEKNIDQAIIAIPSAPGKDIRRLMKICEETKVDFKITPGLSDIIGDKVSINQLRDVKIEDLLRRPVINLDLSAISEYLTDRVVLITGGGGSIGSELCRQIKRFSPKTLVMIDKDENSMYHIHLELSNQSHQSTDLVPIVTDVKNKSRLMKYFHKYKPDIVFHAAAHKHVPLMERNVQEVIENNILGTKNLLELSEEFLVKDFVLISTDKAVNPMNAMGATKRLCEVLVQSAAKTSKTKISAVRFGNVLGSTGSVVPLFKSQIAKGGPVTVTHDSMTRFFMTIPEAVSLVIQTGALSQGGEIFILDMGEPIKIIDLARDLIHLSGFEEGKDMDIKVVGLRPGEKIHEKLFFDKRSISKTSHKKIFVTAPSNFDQDKVKKLIDELLLSCVKNTAEESKSLLIETANAFNPEEKKSTKTS